MNVWFIGSHFISAFSVTVAAVWRFNKILTFHDLKKKNQRKKTFVHPQSFFLQIYHYNVNLSWIMINNNYDIILLNPFSERDTNTALLHIVYIIFVYMTVDRQRHQNCFYTAQVYPPTVQRHTG